MSLPSVLLVPGAWHKPDHWRPLMEELADVDVQVVALASSGDDPATLKDMYADADVIAQAAAAKSRPVIVVAHSYGGVPATQALSRAKNVHRIIYLAAFQLDVGEALLTVNEGALMPWAKLHHSDGVGDYVEAVTPRTVFYNDLDDATAESAASRLGYQSYASMRQPLTEAAWRTIASTYVVCEADNAIPVAAQERMAERADDLHRLNASHSPFLSQPSTVARLIRRFVYSA